MNIHPFYIILIGGVVMAIAFLIMINVLEYYEKKHKK